MRSKKEKRSKGTAFLCLLLMFCFMITGASKAYAATSAEVTLDVKQIFTRQNGSPPSNTFTYKLEEKEPGNPMPAGSVDGVYTFTISGTKNAAVGPISFTHTGIYKYELYQYVDSATSGYTYDNQKYDVTIYVDYELKTSTVIERQPGVKTDTLFFENYYAKQVDGAGSSDPSLMVDPPVKKTVSGTPAEDSTFVFTLTPSNATNPMPAGSINGVKTITITGSGEKDFGTWTYTCAGIYYYKIAEVNTHETDYTYDTEVYTITDVVKAVDGQLKVSRTVTNNANKLVQSCIFINVYNGQAENSGLKKPNQKTAAPNGPQTGDSLAAMLYLFALTTSLMVAVLCIWWLMLLHKRGEDENAAIE